MASAKHELPEADQRTILELIATFEPSQFNPKGALPTAITKVQGTEFFPIYRNDYEGYFIDVQYENGLYEIWFIVDVRASLADDDWFLERVR